MKEKRDLPLKNGDFPVRYAKNNQGPNHNLLLFLWVKYV